MRIQYFTIKSSITRFFFWKKSTGPWKTLGGKNCRHWTRCDWDSTGCRDFHTRITLIPLVPTVPKEPYWRVVFTRRRDLGRVSELNPILFSLSTCFLVFGEEIQRMFTTPQIIRRITPRNSFKRKKSYWLRLKDKWKQIRRGNLVLV